MVKWIFKDLYVSSNKLLFITYITIIILMILITALIVIKEVKNDNK